MKSVALTRIEEARKQKPHLLERRIPFEVYKRQQAQISRRRLYPVTLFYTTFSVVVLVLGFRSTQPILAVSFFVEGVILWTLIEYLFHRYFLHGSFPEGRGIVHAFLHRRLDPLHWEHHGLWYPFCDSTCHNSLSSSWLQCTFVFIILHNYLFCQVCISLN